MIFGGNVPASACAPVKAAWTRGMARVLMRQLVMSGKRLPLSCPVPPARRRPASQPASPPAYLHPLQHKATAAAEEEDFGEIPEEFAGGCM